MISGPKEMSDNYRHDLQLFYKRPDNVPLHWINKHIYPTEWGPFAGGIDPGCSKEDLNTRAAKEYSEAELFEEVRVPVTEEVAEGVKVRKYFGPSGKMELDSRGRLVDKGIW